MRRPWRLRRLPTRSARRSRRPVRSWRKTRAGPDPDEISGRTRDWPLARVVPMGAPFPERWSEGLMVQCKSFVFGVIPIGVRTVGFEKIDQKNYEIQSREHDPLISRWDHLISIKPQTDSRSIYR